MILEEIQLNTAKLIWPKTGSTYRFKHAVVSDLIVSIKSYTLEFNTGF